MADRLPLRNAMRWTEKADIFSDVYGERGLLRGVGSLSIAERPFFCVRPFAIEMNNGGFWAFFYNATGAFTAATINALHYIGATTSAALLRQAVPVYFGPHAVPVDPAARRAILVAIDGDRTRAADRLTSAYYEAGEPLEPLLAAHAAANIAQLSLTDDEAVTATLLEGDWRQCAKCSDAWQETPAEPMAWCPTCRSLTLVRTA